MLIKLGDTHTTEDMKLGQICCRLTERNWWEVAGVEWNQDRCFEIFKEKRCKTKNTINILLFNSTFIILFSLYFCISLIIIILICDN